jgi:asparagine synthase (glutamine-hydrolysing)
MCGIAGIAGIGAEGRALVAMAAAQRHRGPDDEGIYVDPGVAGLAHNRLSIIDLSAAGHQPMANRDGSLWIVFNGEIYNYLELRAELSDYPYSSRTDTEVVLAAWEKWGDQCLDRFIGMFAFLIWDTRSRRLFAARDRFGVKPLYYRHAADGTLSLASEIKALHAAGAPRRPDERTWAAYLALGHSDHSPRTFWEGISALPPGHRMTWHDGRINISCWYDLADRVDREFDRRPAADVQEEYLALVEQSVRLRFRADVPVGINLSGGLDSSVLLGLVDAVHGRAADVKAYTFITGDPLYDELPWVRRMLAHTGHESVTTLLDAESIPALAESVMRFEDEPFGGFPTLAYARLFEHARSRNTIVLLDGQGMDEQWAGYDYYARTVHGNSGEVQGTERPIRPECLAPGFRALAEPFEPPRPFPDELRNLQYRDIRYTKIPRALRFNDRASMRSSTELREPFLDHRMLELALRQPPEYKIVNGTRKWLLRQMADKLVPSGVHEAPKRPLQTPQREWLRGPLRAWAEASIEHALETSWFTEDAVRRAWRDFCDGRSDNSFYIWQWMSLGMLSAQPFRAARVSKRSSVTGVAHA